MARKVDEVPKIGGSVGSRPIVSSLFESFEAFSRPSKKPRLSPKNPVLEEKKEKSPVLARECSRPKEAVGDGQKAQKKERREPAVLKGAVRNLRKKGERNPKMGKVVAVSLQTTGTTTTGGAVCVGRA